MSAAPQWSMGWRVFIGVAGGFAALSVGWALVDSRGPALGAAAGLFFGMLTTSIAWKPTQVRRWFVRHPVLDSMLFLPISFILLLGVFPQVPLGPAAR